MMKIEAEQEILMYMADMIIDTFQAESALLRAMKMQANNHENASAAIKAVQVFISDAADRINHAGKNAINAFADGDEQRLMLMGLKRFTKTSVVNTKELRRQLAARLVDKQAYIF